MDVIENPILTFSALSLIIILLSTSLYMLRARMVLLENKLIESDGTNQAGLSQLKEIVVSSLEQSEASGKNNMKELLEVLSERIDTSAESINSSVKESQASVENSVSGLLHTNDQKVTGLISSLTEDVVTVAQNVKNNAVHTKSVVERNGLKVSEAISDSEALLAKQINEVAVSISAAEAKGFNELKTLKTDLVGKIDSSTKEQTHKLIGDFTIVADSTKALIKDSADSLTDSLELVRVSNVMTENRNLYDQGRLVLETEAFVKTFDSCQLTQIEDKETGQVTKNEFQDGQISSSKTYRTDSLEYVGHYQEGVLKTMEDLTGPEGSKVTQYEYDEAGEVESVI